MVGLDRVEVGVDVDVAAGVENPRYAPRMNGSGRSAALESGGVVRNADTLLSVTIENVELPQTSIQEKIAVLETDAGLYGQRRAKT